MMNPSIGFSPMLLAKRQGVLQAVLLPVLLCWGLQAQAQVAAQAQPWTLQRVLQETALTHPTVKTKQSELRAAEFDLDGAEWGRFPKLSTEALAVQGGVQMLTRLQQPLWSGNRITSQIELSAATVTAARAAVSEAQQSLMLDAVNTFFEIQRYQARLKAAQDNEVEHQRLLSIIERRVSADVSPNAEATQGRARLQQAITERLQFQRQLENLRATLEQLVGQPARELVFPRDVRVKALDSTSLVEAALSYSPERQRLTAQVEEGQAQIAVAKSAVMPLVALGYELRGGRLGFREERTRFFVGVTAQTGAGLSSLSSVDAATARQQAARDGLDKNRRQLEQAIQTGWNEVQALSAQLEPSRDLLAASDEVVDSYLRQFQVGRKSWLDVLNAQREKTNARYALADAEASLQLAKVRLLVLSGTVKPDSMIALHE